MKKKLKVRKIGNSYGVVIPKEILNDLQVEEGQSLYFSKSEKGYEVSKTVDEYSKQMTIAKDVINRYRNTLTELAK